MSNGAPPVASGPRPEGAGAIGGLARFVAEARLGDWPDEVRLKAKACLLYGLAVGAAGARTRLPRQVARMLDRTETGGGDGSAHRMLDGMRTAPGAAAFANAVLLHARIQEDAPPAGHVGVVVIPAALAAAEHTGADGEALLAGIVAGYETALRIGRGHAAAASRRGFRTTPLYGVIGAAAAAARLHGLPPERTADALSLAANHAGGLREFAVAGTDEYVLQAGSAARSGLTSAWCAVEGMRGAPTILEGPAGFLRAFGGEEAGGVDSCLVEGLGSSFEMMAVTGKRWPVCQFHRGVVRSVLALRAAAAAGTETARAVATGGMATATGTETAGAVAAGGAAAAAGTETARAVATGGTTTAAGTETAGAVAAGGAVDPAATAPAASRIRVTMNPFEADFFGVRRTEVFESFAHTFMSAPFCAALAWVEGAVTLAGMHAFADPRVLAVARRVDVIASPERPRYQPRVEIVLEDGRKLARADAEPDDVLDWARARTMATALMAESDAPEEAGIRLAEAVDALDRGGSVLSVVQAACGAARHVCA
ncbi:MAG: MmgE/PrpD family protein [Thiotrichales bacterium]|nr:MmgE/PrpD family protein [Thiotrichales bacterium]